MYSETIQSHIFNPLGMSHSYTSKAAAQHDGLAVGYRYWFSRPFPTPNLPVPQGSLPSGQLISSAEDMAHYLIAHLNGGRYLEAQILSSAGIAELQRGAAEYVKWGISGGVYGMGWFTIDLGQTKTLSHGGNVPDFSAFMALIPEQKTGVVLLLNANPGGLPPVLGEIGMGLTALLAGQPPPPLHLGFVPWFYRLLPLLPLVQLAGALATLGMLRRWRHKPALRPSNSRIWGEHLLLPLIPNLSLMAILVYLRSSGLIRFLNVFMPDLAWIARISGGFAGVWALLRTVLTLLALRKHRA